MQNLTFCLHATLSNAKKAVAAYARNQKYANIFIGLSVDLAKKLKKQAKKQGKAESAVLRNILDDYLKKLKKQHCLKQQCVGLQRLARTIRREQDIKLRKIAEETGMTISEVVREALG